MSNPVFLHVSLDSFRTYVDRYSTNSIVLMDNRRRIKHCNPVFLQIAGYTDTELKGQDLEAYLTLDRPVSEVVRFCERPGFSEDNAPEATMRCVSGATMAFKCEMLQIELDREPCYLLILRRERPCPPLSLLQQFGGTFLQDVNLGVLLIDTEFRLIDISDMACRVLGLVRGAVRNLPMEEVFASVPPEHQLVRRTILDGMVVRNQAISWTHNEERYELLLDSNVLRDDKGRIVGAYIIFKDVTNLRSLEQQVQRSDRLAMIGQIAAGTAHEIRNPLTSIKGFLQVLHKTFQDQGMVKESGYTNVMLAEIDRINELVNEFLLLSKPKHISFEEVDISQVLRGILPIINNEAILHGVVVQYEASYPMPKVVADRELLKQVFLNICKNGIEAMVDGGHLTVTERVDQEDKQVHIDIHDTGPGIPLFVIDKIFDPFFTTKAEGTGLGLSVCQRIIHDMGGSIRVSSKGFGTTFTVSMPFP